MARTDFIFNIGKELNYQYWSSAIMLIQNNVQDLIANLATTVSTDEIKQTKAVAIKVRNMHQDNGEDNVAKHCAYHFIQLGHDLESEMF
jgi:hypothetical protein